MGRTRYKPEIKRNQTFTLNITSMTDMFTIMLVFLLQSFASGQVNIEPVAGLRLPSSNSDKNPIEGVKLSMSQSELRIDQKTLAQIKNNEVESSAVDPKDLNFIRPLFDELQKLNAKSGVVLLQADQELPYSTLRKVMYTASMAGFPNVKLVTSVSE